MLLVGVPWFEVIPGHLGIKYSNDWETVLCHSITKCLRSMWLNLLQPTAWYWEGSRNATSFYLSLISKLASKHPSCRRSTDLSSPLYQVPKFRMSAKWCQDEPTHRLRRSFHLQTLWLYSYGDKIPIPKALTCRSTESHKSAKLKASCLWQPLICLKARMISSLSLF